MFKILAVAAALAFGAQSSAIAQQQPVVTLKFHTFMAPASNVWQNMHMAWMDKVEKESNGRIKFERFPAMQLGGTPLQLYDQVRDGVADITWTLAGNTPNRFPSVDVFELPFMMTTAEATSRAYWEYAQKYAKDEFKETHVIALHVHGPGMFHSRGKEITSVGDLRGMKVRGPTRTITRMLGVLGATPVAMPLPQIPDALSKGVVDAVVVPWEVTTAVKVDELARSHSEFPQEAGGLYTTAFVLAMNRAKYDALPADLKKVIDDNSGLETSGWLGRVQQAGDAPARRVAVEERKNKVITIRGAELEGFRKASIQLQDEWAKEMDGKGRPGRQMLEDAKALIQKHSR
jgi:TRAP-type transport system periplasmic protein